MLHGDVLSDIEAFDGLRPEERAALEKHLELISTSRGQFLVSQGEPARALYIVVTGRFEVLRNGAREAIAEIGPGQPVGEIAFFSGGQRTASVRAQRDSLSLRLSVDDFNQLAQANPGVWPVVTRTMAQRLARTTASGGGASYARPRTICICRAGQGGCPEPFIKYVQETFGERQDTLILTRQIAEDALSGAQARTGLFDSAEATQWFNELEGRFNTIIYLTDPDVSAWSLKALHQADQVLFVGWHSAAACGGDELQRNDLERHAGELFKPANIRLVLMHERLDTIFGTRSWLERRPRIGMHHHIGIGRREDFDRFFRFVFGEAVGLVACGGGAFTAAHVGSFEALREEGIRFDILGGTSGGAAMCAGFALGVPVAQMSRHIQEMFVKRKAMGRWTFPRYSFLDHTVMNEVLAEYFSSIDIEDLWLPYFAVATNLSKNQLWPISQGPLWEAIRASSAIPALFPPVFSRTGDMLVDGCLIDNIPVRTMRSLKTGPNVILNLDIPRPTPRPVDHRELPSRWNLIRQMLFSRGDSPNRDAQGPHTVLMRSLLRENADLSGLIGPRDLYLASPIPADANALDWSDHEIFRSRAYTYAKQEIAKSRLTGHPLLN